MCGECGEECEECGVECGEGCGLSKNPQTLPQFCNYKKKIMIKKLHDQLPKEFCDDMSELKDELKSHNIPYKIEKHLGAFGDYEAYGGKFKELKRFKTAKELVESILT